MTQSQSLHLRYETHGVERLGSMTLFPFTAMLKTAVKAASRRDKVTGGNYGGFGIERHFHDCVMDGNELYAHYPRFFELYMRGHHMAQHRLPGRMVNLSPWRQSAMTLKSYNKVGDQHGWHVETNGLSVIVCIDGEARLDFMNGAQPPTPYHAGDFHLLMQPGEAYLLRGHDVWHRVPPVRRENLPRTTIVMNYYIDDDFSRPDGMDEQHYA